MRKIKFKKNVTMAEANAIYALSKESMDKAVDNHDPTRGPDQLKKDTFELLEDVRVRIPEQRLLPEFIGTSEHVRSLIQKVSSSDVDRIHIQIFAVKRLAPLATIERHSPVSSMVSLFAASIVERVTSCDWLADRDNRRHGFRDRAVPQRARPARRHSESDSHRVPSYHRTPAQQPCRCGHVSLLPK